MKILVCGGRAFHDYAALEAILSTYPACTHIVHGGATGADTLAERYAKARALNVTTFPAHWRDLTAPGAVVKYQRNGTPYNAAAGAARNRRMLDTSMPDLVVAFPGGTGTQDMTRYARKQGYTVRIVTEDEIAQLHAARSA